MSFIGSAKEWFNWKVNSAYIVSQTSYMLSWYCMRVQRRKILRLLQSIELITKPFKKLKINAWMTAVFFHYFMLYPIVLGALSHKEYRDSYLDFLMYGLNFGSELFKNVYFAANLMMLLSFINFCNAAIIMLFLMICQKVTTSLEEFESCLNSISSGEIVNAEFSLADKYIRIINALKEVQRIFSMASFFLCLGYIASSFATLSFLLLKMKTVSKPIVFEHLFVFSSNAISLISVFYFAGRIPIKMMDIKSAFYAKYITVSSVSCNVDLSTKLSTLNKLVDLPEIVLSGCDILYYTKQSIFSAFGIFITYGLLLLQFNKQDIHGMP
ncbi:hypothetical protein TNCV_4028801 [Trichonephila clavipes]|nr:hypothetical protein TNCV_4028801 [Trichonephila clavipes]